MDREQSLTGLNREASSEPEPRQPSIKNDIEDGFENSEPLVYTDSERCPDDDMERLTRMNKKYLRLLERAGELHQFNKEKQRELEIKRERVKEEKARLQSLRNKRKMEQDEKKQRLILLKEQLKTKSQNQGTRISDLSLTLDLIKSLNSREVTHIHSPQTIEHFQTFLNDQYSRLQHQRTAEKIRCILAQQNSLLDNLLSIQQQLSK